MNSLSKLLSIGLACAASAIPVSAADFIIDFDSVAPDGGGTPFNTDPIVFTNFGGSGVTVSFSSPSSSTLSYFDSSGSISGVPNDSDLQTPGDASASSGNPAAGSGNTAADWANNGYVFGDAGGADQVLVVQENSASAPNDEGSGGTIIVSFSAPVVFNSFGIVDLEGKGKKLKVFTDGIGSPFKSYKGIEDNSYFEDIGLGKDVASSIKFKSKDSFALSGIGFSVVPEPGTLLLGSIAAGFAALGYRRRNSSVASEKTS